MPFRVRIRGINAYIRDLARTNDRAYRAAREGTVEAAEYLLEAVREKIGVYQPGWARLKHETVKKKWYKYGVGDEPLLASGEMRDSFRVIEGGRGRLSATVYSSSDYLIHHVYGAPGASVPRRDPIRVTAIEEMDMCHQIIEEKILEAIDNGW